VAATTLSLAEVGVTAPRGLADVGVLDQIGQGGLIAWAIIGLSIILVALAIARLLSLRLGTLCPDELLLQVEEQAGAGRLGEAARTVGGDPSALAVVLDVVFRNRELAAGEARQQIQDAAAEQLIRLRQQISYIGLIAAVAPMLGLLGTVSGMIRAFDTMSTAELAPDHGQLAGAISEALITTYLGLTVAIPALVVHLVLRNRITNIVLRITAGAEQVNALIRVRPAGGGRRNAVRPAGGSRA